MTIRSNRFVRALLLTLVVLALLLISGAWAKERDATEERVSESPPKVSSTERLTNEPAASAKAPTAPERDTKTIVEPAPSVTGPAVPHNAPSAASPEAPNIFLNWYTVSSGGTVEVASASYKMGLTNGQTAYDRVASASYIMRLGFWQPFSGGSSTCCVPPTVGDCDQSGGVDITDVSVLVDNQFLTLTPLICDAEGDLDFSGTVDITDLSVLIDNQFLTLTPLPPCP